MIVWLGSPYYWLLMLCWLRGGKIPLLRSDQGLCPAKRSPNGRLGWTAQSPGKGPKYSSKLVEQR